MTPTADVTVSDAVWIATALLQREAPDKPSFSVEEIVERVGEGVLPARDAHRVEIHATLQCVANMRPNPSDLRYLVATPDGGRRLFRPGDPQHPDRYEGAMHPEDPALPPAFRDLLPWYQNTYLAGAPDLDEVGEDEDVLAGGTLSYRVLRVGDAREAELMLRNYASEGWRLVEALTVEDEEGPSVWLILER